MSAAAWNVMIALAWLLITGSFTIPNFMLGLGVGWLMLFACRPIPGMPRYPQNTLCLLVLVAYTGWAVVVASLRVSRDVLLLRGLRPALVAVPIRSRTDTEITLLALLITLTPGTTAIDVCADGTQLLVHVTNLPAGGPERVRDDLREGLERLLLRALR